MKRWIPVVEANLSLFLLHILVFMSDFKISFQPEETEGCTTREEVGILQSVKFFTILIYWIQHEILSSMKRFMLHFPLK